MISETPSDYHRCNVPDYRGYGPGSIYQCDACQRYWERSRVFLGTGRLGHWGWHSITSPAKSKAQHRFWKVWLITMPLLLLLLLVLAFAIGSR